MNQLLPENSNSEIKWAKVLYKDFGMPDNYTDKTFLEGLQKNVHFEPVSFTQSVYGSTRIAVYLSVIYIFISIYSWLNTDIVTASHIFQFSALLCIFFMTCFWWRNSSPITVRDNILFLVVTYSLAPILKTLTESISTDSIYAISTILLILHLVFNDYGVPYSVVSKQISLSTSLCAATCLASRLPTPYHVFSLLTTAICLFAMFPHFYSLLEYSENIAIILIPGSLLCVYSVDPSWSLLAGVLAFCLVIILPYIFVRSQRFKSNISGPWDEAILRSNS